MSDLYCC